MAIFLDDETRVIVQGVTGREGKHHTQQMLAYGTKIVGGVTPGKGGDWIHSKPIFDTVRNAVKATGANTSIVFVPRTTAADAIYEAIDAGIQLIVCITEGIPLLDIIRVREYIRNTPSRLIGPNCPGVLVPNVANLGIIPPEVATRGKVGIISRSGTLTYEIAQRLSAHGIGQSTIVGIGGDPVLGTNIIDVLKEFENDMLTEEVLIVGEIGGFMENDAATYIQTHMTKSVTAYITGRHAPSERPMGHMSAIIDAPGTDADTKINLLNKAGVRIAESIFDLPELFSNR